jgi:hypothetical protein
MISKDIFKNWLNPLFFFLLILAHFLFLSAIVLENLNSGIILLTILILILFLTLAYLEMPINQHKKQFTPIISVCFVTLGALLTYYLSHHLAWGSVIAASSIALLASYIAELDQESTVLKVLPSAIYCGAFVGMSSLLVISNLIMIGLAGFIAGLIFTITHHVFDGCGGKLGTIAFISVVITTFIINFIVLI